MVKSHKEKMKVVTDRLSVFISPLNNVVVDVMMNICAIFEVYGLCYIHPYPPPHLTSVNDLKIFMTVGRLANTKDCCLQCLKIIKYRLIDEK